MNQVVLFDLDGTLIDEKVYAQIYPKIIKLVRQKLRGKDFEQFCHAHRLRKNRYGRYDSGDICRKAGLLKEYYQILENEIKRSSVVRSKGMVLLRKLRKQGYAIGIVSNSMKRTIRLYVNAYSLKPDFIFSSENAGCRKDNPLFWKRLAKAQKLNPQECLVIGDDPVEDGVVPGKLGFRTRWV